MPFSIPKPHTALGPNEALAFLIAHPAKSTGLLVLGFFAIKLLQTIYTGLLGGSLRHVPGPFITRFTHWPLRLATLQGRKIYYVDDLHQKYGNCVRLSPTEASIADVQSVKDIHKIGGGFLKAPWYHEFTQEPEAKKGVFAMRDAKVHATRRKLLANGFSKNNLLANWEETIQQKVNMACNGIRQDAVAHGEANILAWFTFMANDIIATLSFGDSFHCLEAGKKTDFIRDLETILMMSGVAVELTWIRPILLLFSPRHRLSAKGREAYLANQAREKSGTGTVTGTIFSKMFDAGGKSESLTVEDVTTEAGNLLVAGSDTTGNTLTYLVWAVLTHPDVKAKLIAEVATLETGFTSKDAMELPYVALVIQETLRLYGAAPGGLPRSVPQGGRLLANYYFPANSVVSTQAYTLHRNAAVFADPLKFIPERWLSPSQSMKDSFMPWGGGTRICLGLHLAMQELSLGAASFFREFPDARLAPSTTPETMQLENYFLIAPKGHACMVSI